VIEHQFKTLSKRFWQALASLERNMMVSLMLSMTLLYGVSVLLNNVSPGLARHFGWTEELSRLFMVWLVFVGLGYGLERGRHVSMDLANKLVRPSLLRVLRRIIDGVGTVFCFYAAYLGWTFVERILASGQISNVLNISIAWFYAAMPVGMVLIGIRYLRYLLYPDQRTADESNTLLNH
jgi:TRAP-type C4-dicarboxylate transport system permease small subunit